MNAKLVTSDGCTLVYKRVGAGPLLVCHCGGAGFPCATTGDHDYFAPDEFREEVGRFLAA